MDTFSTKLNELLLSAFQSVLKIEEQMLRQMGSIHLSISEMHLIEAVGNGGEQGRLVSELARDLSIAPPSVTAAVKKLEHKGLLTRTKGEKDGRTVVITLTGDGEKINRVHHHFHQNMVQGIARDMDGQEQQVLLEAMEKLNHYFDRRLIRQK